MAGRPEDKPMVREERKRRSAAAGEPLFDRDQSLSQMGNSGVVTIPVTARDILGIDVGDDVSVEVYDDGIWISDGGTDE